MEDFGHGTEFRKQLSTSKPHLMSDFLEHARDFYYDLLTGFVTACRHVVVFVKGLAEFDPKLLFREDAELAYECLSCLFDMFQQRGWFEAKEKPSMIMEYQSFMVNLQLESVDSAGRPFPIVSVSFSTLPSFADKTLLQKLFRLSCLCLPLKGTPPTPVSLGLEFAGLSSEGARSLIMPLYSFVQQLGSCICFLFRQRCNGGMWEYNRLGFGIIQQS